MSRLQSQLKLKKPSEKKAKESNNNSCSFIMLLVVMVLLLQIKASQIKRDVYSGKYHFHYHSLVHYKYELNIE